MATPVTDVIIVGAGISGLLAATVLQQNGKRVTLLEKSRGVGGRMATRRVDDAVFDHGVQYFTAKYPQFQTWVDQWEKEGLVREWFSRFPNESHEAGHKRYKGVPSMTSVAKHLAASLDIRRNARVLAMQFDNRRWMVTTEAGNTYEGHFLLITAPVPQAREMLDHSNIELRPLKYDALKGIHYHRCLTLMATLDKPLQLGGFGGLRNPGPGLRWLGDNLAKGISTVPAITVHTGNDLAESLWDDGEEHQTAKILEAVEDQLGGAQIVKASCHRWRYNEPVRHLTSNWFFSRRHNLSMAGDGFAGPRVEAAAMSGLAAAEHLLDFV